jgi:hypothetical protein
VEVGAAESEAALSKQHEILSEKQLKSKTTGVMAQHVQHFSSKCKVLSSIPTCTKNKTNRNVILRKITFTLKQKNLFCHKM